MKKQKDRTLKDELPPRSVGVNMLLEISGEITPERMKRRRQSKNKHSGFLTTLPPAPATLICTLCKSKSLVGNFWKSILKIYNWNRIYIISLSSWRAKHQATHAHTLTVASWPPPCGWPVQGSGRSPAKKTRCLAWISQYQQKKQHCSLSCSWREAFFPSQIFIGGLTFNAANIISAYSYSVAPIFII